MSKPIMVSCDSACDLVPGMQEKYGIAVMPMYVQDGDKTFRDGVDITPEDIYRVYEEQGILPKTSAIPPEEYAEFFHQFTDQGYAVLHIGLSSGISSTCQNAAIAAADMEDVYVLDSLALSCSGGLLAVQACQLRDQGMDVIAVRDAIAKRITETNTSFIVGNLTFLAKGGRCSSATAMGANILGIKPAVEMPGGELVVGKKYRGKTADCFERFLKDKVELARAESDGGVGIFYHAGLDKALTDHLLDIVQSSGVFREVLFAHAGSIICSHCGRETIGFTYQKK